MTVEALAAVGGAPEVAWLEGAAPVQDTATTAFDTVLESFESLNTRLAAGQESVSQLALGNADNLHQIMISGEQTRLTFELMLAVRNKVLEAYQELMRMQV